MVWKLLCMRCFVWARVLGPWEPTCECSWTVSQYCSSTPIGTCKDVIARAMTDWTLQEPKGEAVTEGRAAEAQDSWHCGCFPGPSPRDWGWEGGGSQSLIGRWEFDGLIWKSRKSRCEFIACLHWGRKACQIQRTFGHCDNEKIKRMHSLDPQFVPGLSLSWSPSLTRHVRKGGASGVRGQQGPLGRE